jgi:hypothetical protein
MLIGALGYHFVFKDRGADTARTAVDVGDTDRQKGTPDGEQLYSDAEIEAMLRRLSDVLGSNEDLLDLVPNGTAAPLVTVLGAIGLKQSRLKFKKEWGVNFVQVVHWQISPSYVLVYMTGNNDPDNRDLSKTDPRRSVYGVEIYRSEDK